MNKLFLPVLELENKYDFLFTIDGRLSKLFRFKDKDFAFESFVNIMSNYSNRYLVQLIELNEYVYLAISEYILSVKNNKLKVLFSTTKDIQKDFIRVYNDLTKIERDLKLEVSEWPLFEVNYIYENLDNLHIYKLKQFVYKDNVKELERLLDVSYCHYIKLPFENNVKVMYISDLKLEDLLKNRILVIEYFDKFKLKAFYLFMPLSINSYLADIFKI